jgi:hypothetical protein
MNDEVQHTTGNAALVVAKDAATRNHGQRSSAPESEFSQCRERRVRLAEQ